MSRSEMLRTFMGKSGRRSGKAAGRVQLPENPAGVVELTEAEMNAETGADGCPHVRTIHLSCWDPDCSFVAPTSPDYNSGTLNVRG